jgi:hypothetical protein
MTRTRSLITGAVLALGGAGCGIPAQDGADPIEPDAVPFGLLEAGEPPLVPTVTGPAAQVTDLCFVAEDRLLVVPVELGAPVELADVARALAEPPVVAADRPVTSAVDATAVREVSLDAGVATVDLGGEVASLGPDRQVLAIAQLVCALTLRPGVGQVAFTLDGVPVEVPTDDGSLRADPVSRDDYEALLP